MSSITHHVSTQAPPAPQLNQLTTLPSINIALPSSCPQIVSTIMYHVSTVGALNGTQLAQRGDLPTVLEGASLLVGVHF